MTKQFLEFDGNELQQGRKQEITRTLFRRSVEFFLLITRSVHV